MGFVMKFFAVFLMMLLCAPALASTESSGVEATIVRELEELAHRHGFVPSEHQVDLVGLCADCQ